MTRPEAIPLSTQLTPEELAAPVNGASLKDKSVLITGGASGLGAGIALAYAEKGAYVTLADINEPLGNEYTKTLQEKGLKVQFVATDVTSWTAQVAAFKAAVKFSPTQDKLDIVVASAGLAGEPFITPNEEIFSLETDPAEPNVYPLQVNSIGMLYTAKLTQLYTKIPSSTPSVDPPSFIIIVSLVAYLDFPIMAAYTASKYAARGLFRAIRPLFSDRGIRVNVIAPWIVETPLVHELIKIFKNVGAPEGDPNQVVTTAVMLADDNTINGRAFSIGPKRVLDLGDDLEGKDAGEVMHGYHETEMQNWSKHAAAIAALMGA